MDTAGGLSGKSTSIGGKLNQTKVFRPNRNFSHNQYRPDDKFAAWAASLGIRKSPIGCLLNMLVKFSPKYRHALASQASSTSTISDISQSRLVTLAAIAGVTRSVL